jgi:hypothetical protein
MMKIWNYLDNNNKLRQQTQDKLSDDQDIGQVEEIHHNNKELG